MRTQLEYSVEAPLNREPPIRELIQSFITDTGTAYDRNHGPLPHINAEDFRVLIDGAVKAPVKLSISELRNSFPQHEAIAALQVCIQVRLLRPPN